MKGLMWTIDEKMPKWQLAESRIGDNPGLGYRPTSENLTQGSLIWFDSKNETQVIEYTGLISKFLKRKFFMPRMSSFTTNPYSPILSHSAYINQTLEPRNNSMKCDFATPTKPNFVCRVDLNALGTCTADNLYGYNTSQPCVFLKLNRVNVPFRFSTFLVHINCQFNFSFFSFAVQIFNWTPEVYNETNLPKTMPDDLKIYIQSLSATEVCV